MPDEYLLIRYHEGTANQTESKTVEDWLAASEMNQNQYQDLVKIWTHSEQAAIFQQFDVESDWAKVRARVQPKAKQRSLFQNRYRWLMAAAIAFLLIASGIYVWQNSAAEIQMISHHNPIGAQVMQVALDDGSQIHLNQGSTISYPKNFSADQRRVSLSGEAYFDVAADPKRPFIIETNHTRTEVLGTAFNLRAFDGESNEVLTVLEGTVKYVDLSGFNTGVLLEAGMFAQLEIESNRLIQEEATDLNALAWKTNHLIFLDSPIRSVLESFRKHYRQPVFLKEGIPGADCPYSNHNINQSFEEAFGELRDYFDMQYEYTGDSLMIIAIQCE